jgi:starvation-inducible outer membrane lipoprotein
MNKYFLMLVGALSLGLSACASIDRSTASDESVQVDKPSSLDRNSQF